SEGDARIVVPALIGGLGAGTGSKSHRNAGPDPETLRKAIAVLILRADAAADARIETMIDVGENALALSDKLAVQIIHPQGETGLRPEILRIARRGAELPAAGQQRVGDETEIARTVVERDRHALPPGDVSRQPAPC